MPSYLDGFIVGVVVGSTLTGLVVFAVVAIATWPGLMLGLRRFGRDVIRGWRDFWRAFADIFGPRTIPLPRWVQRLLRRIRR